MPHLNTKSQIPALGAHWARPETLHPAGRPASPRLHPSLQSLSTPPCRKVGALQWKEQPGRCNQGTRVGPVLQNLPCAAPMGKCCALSKSRRADGEWPGGTHSRCFPEAAMKTHVGDALSKAHQGTGAGAQVCGPNKLPSRHPTHLRTLEDAPAPRRRLTCRGLSGGCPVRLSVCRHSRDCPRAKVG